MTRPVSYIWQLSNLMAVNDLFSPSDLRPLLADRGIHLSAPQLSRLISGIPLRISLPVLAALCDVLACTPADLIVVSVEKPSTSDSACF